MEYLEPGKPADPKWVRNASGRFFRLALLDPESEGLSGQGGVFVVWHAGVRPRWMAIGQTNDLARQLHELGENQDVMSYEKNGGIWVTWSPVLSQYRGGVVNFLRRTLKPMFEFGLPATKDAPIPVLPPGSTVTDAAAPR
jgi:hypothetical protein